MESPRFLALLEEMAEIHRKKAAGYSGYSDEAWANFREASSWGVEPWRACLVRLSDKYKRMQSLVRDPDNEQVGEAITDTAIDLAAYALIFICLWDEDAGRIDKG